MIGRDHRAGTEDNTTMGGSGGADAGLFAGTAWYYARYRPRYPRALLDVIVDGFDLDGGGRLLDLGCGTGELAVPLAAHVADVVALDVSAEMIAEARTRAERAGVTNVRCRQMAAEAITPDLGRFRLVTAGSAFHWMDRDLVLRRCREVIEPGGGIAIVGFVGGTFWGSDVPWEQAVVDVIGRWLGPERRAGAGVFRPADQPRHEVVLARSAFRRTRTGEIRTRQVWTIDALIGYLYSTSFCSPVLLGGNRPAFEDDLRRTLLALDISGRFEQTLVAQYILAWPA